MEGFINIRIAAWLRRLIGRCITIIPALIGIFIFGDVAFHGMMIASQIILSLQLPFAISPYSIYQRYKNNGLFCKFTMVTMVRIHNCTNHCDC